MTNYNERLDEILKDIIHIGYVSGYNQVAHEARISPYNHIEPLTIAEAKHAITSLIKELVAEAKPGTWVDPEDTDDLEWQGYVKGVNDFEQNLLKALEEV